MGLENRQLPPENDTLYNAITQKHKVGMSTYIKTCISLCPPEWYQSAQIRVLAHGLFNDCTNAPDELETIENRLQIFCLRHEILTPQHTL